MPRADPGLRCGWGEFGKFTGRSADRCYGHSRSPSTPGAVETPDAASRTDCRGFPLPSNAHWWESEHL